MSDEEERRKASDQLQQPIVRILVDEDHLEIPVTLIHQRQKQPFQLVETVDRTDDEAEQGRPSEQTASQPISGYRILAEVKMKVTLGIDGKY